MLQARIRHLKEGRNQRGPVLYWMSRDQRVNDNWALICAQDMALRDKVPLLVAFCLVPEYLGAARRQYTFMLAGLKEVSGCLHRLSVPFFLLVGEPGDVIPRF